MAVRVPEFLQTKRYTAKSLRSIFADTGCFQEGIIGKDWTNTDMVPSVVLPTPIMGVSVPPGKAWVQADFGQRGGFYHVTNDDEVIVPISANVSGLTRIDQLVLRVYDEQDGPDDTSGAVFEIVRGTPTAGADLTNRFGAATELPGSSMRVADIEVVSGGGVIESNNDIWDRRPWAYGAYLRGVGIGSADTLGTSSSSNYVGHDFTNLAESLEISSGLVSVHYKANWNAATAPFVYDIAAMIDNVSTTYQPRRISYPLANAYLPIDQKWIVEYATGPGNYMIGVACSRVSGTGQLHQVGNTGFIEIRELLNPTQEYQT